MNKIRAVLFGTTGFGNSALNALTRHSAIELVGVFTNPRQDAPFPYYKCEKLHDLAIRKGITIYEGLSLRDNKSYELIAELSPELIAVSSFNQIVPKAIILLPRFGVINVHPSLLPKYRGATPTVWVLINGEDETGVTVHFIEDEEIDKGRIIAQSALRIEPSDTDGVLRLKLAKLSEDVLVKAIEQILTKNKEQFPQQDDSKATYYPKRSLKDAKIDIHKPFKEIVNKIRAMTPYPGAYINYNGSKYVVTKATLLNEKDSFNHDVIENDGLLVETIEGMVKFQIKKEV